MKKNTVFRIACVICSVVLLILAAGCNKTSADGQYKITVQGTGEVEYSVQYADEGDRVKVDVPRLAGYRAYAVYVDGKRIEGDEFIMPASDVSVKVSYLSEAEGAHYVVIENSADGGIIADFISAEAGTKVTLSSYSSYNRRLESYYLNGQRLEGNTFVMPDCDAQITATYSAVITKTDVKMTVNAGRYDATSYWYAEYTRDGLAVRAVVEDPVIYTSLKLFNAVGMLDNVEYIVGRQSETEFSERHLKLLVAADGQYYLQQYNKTSGWVTVDASGISVEAKVCTIANSGFSGFEVRTLIPYGKLGTTYNSAYGNLAVCPSMRNTLSYFQTNWAYYSGLGCNWNKPATYLSVARDGTFGARSFTVRNLVAGDNIISSFEGATLSAAESSTFTYAVPGSDISWWKDNVAEIAKYQPETVYFSCGIDLENGNYMQCFKDMCAFIDNFKDKVGAKLVIISTVPSVSAQCDYAEVAAYNKMVKEYVAAKGFADYIDLTSHIYKNGVLDTTLYGSADTLSETGTALLNKLFLEKYYTYSAPEGLWGDVGEYITSGVWTQTSDKISLTSGGICGIYLKGNLPEDFALEAQVTVKELYYAEAYPKFGFSLTCPEGARHYFVYADGLTKQIAGVVPRGYFGYDWGMATEVGVKDLKYTLGNYATLRLERSGGIIKFTVNGTVIYSGAEEIFEGNEITLGLFAFNLGLEYKNISFTTGGEVE